MTNLFDCPNFHEIDELWGIFLSVTEISHSALPIKAKFDNRTALWAPQLQFNQNEVDRLNRFY